MIILLAQGKELDTLRETTNDAKTKMDDLIKQNEGNMQFCLLNIIQDSYMF